MRTRGPTRRRLRAKIPTSSCPVGTRVSVWSRGIPHTQRGSAVTTQKTLVKAPRARRSDSRFPIVGIGASAGGIEAFTQLLSHLPADTGMGFVLVQHLAPQHPSVLAHLLSATTPMPVLEAMHTQRVLCPASTILSARRQLSCAKDSKKISIVRATPGVASRVCNINTPRAIRREVLGVMT